MNAIEFNGLSKYYGKNRGVEDLTLDIPQGEFFGFIGPNGAGKSTTIKLMLNILFPTRGNAKIMGLDIVKDTVEIKKIISYVPSEVKFYNNMKIKNLFKLTAQLRGISDDEAWREYADYFQIELDKKFGSLSLGNKKKVAIVDALIGSPQMIILDEPTSGLDPVMQKRLMKLLKEKNDQGTTIFLSSHILSEIQESCNRIGFIKDGSLIKVENIDDEFLGRKVLRLSGDYNPVPLVDMGAVLIRKDVENAVYSYKGDPRILTQGILDSNPDNYTVENPSLEDEFIKYYEEDNHDNL